MHSIGAFFLNKSKYNKVIAKAVIWSILFFSAYFPIKINKLTHSGNFAYILNMFKLFGNEIR